MPRILLLLTLECTKIRFMNKCRKLIKKIKDDLHFVLQPSCFMGHVLYIDILSYVNLMNIDILSYGNYTKIHVDTVDRPRAQE